MLTQLTNLISSRTGRVIHVSSDDFNATDGLDNRGNSPLRPFKSIQRALLEIARYSYVPGFNNDRFSQFSIQLSPGVYFIDNRPGLSSEDEIVPFGFDENTKEWEKDTIVDLGNRDNIYWKYNTTEGGCILPRGSSIVSYDLRHTIIKPLYVPDPVDEGTPRTALFNTTGECYFFGFTIRDAEVNENSPLYDNLSNTGKVYYDRNNYGLLKTPLYSHHKITVFVFASDVELDLYYKKVGKAFSKFQPTIANEGEFDERIEESRIVGPLSDFRSIQSIVLEQTIGVESSTDVIVNLTTSHNYFEGQFIAISNTGIDDLIEGVFQVTSISADNTRQFKYRVPYASTAIGVGYALDPLNPTVIDFNSQPVALDSSASASAEIDTTESASPYVLNCTLRSDWGMCGMWADGLRTSGFKSMVVAQFTGISLQKDDRSFIRYNDSNNTWRQASLSSAFSPDVEHTKGDSYWKTDWRTFHIRASEGAFIQCVSVFAIGEGDHFLMESGGDMSITNSNSNFGDTALHAKGFRGDSFVKDSGGYISHIIPPQELDESLENQSRVSYYTIDIQSTIADSENENKLFIGGDDNIDPYKRPAANVKGQRIGNKQKEKLFVRLDPEVVGGTEVFDAEVVPNGFLKYIARPSNTVAVGAVSGVAAKALDAANLIEANRRLIQEESFGWMLEKYPELRSSKKVFPDRSDFPTEGGRGKLFDAVSLIIKNKRFIQDETLKYILGEFPSLKNTKLFPTDTDQEITPEERRSSACFRDIGFFLDSLTSDLRRGGNKEIVSFANKYNDETGIVHVANEITETKTAFSYAANMAIAAMRNFEFSIEGATGVDGNNTYQKKFRFFDAANLIRKNKRLIQDESIKYILDKFPHLRHFSKVFPTDTNQEITIEERRSSPCFRDIGFFIDALANDLEVGGNTHILEFANNYKDATGIAHITNEIEETKEAYKYAANVATAAMRNFDFSVSGITITNGDVDRFRFFDAANLIKSNRSLIQDETIKQVIDKYPDIVRKFKVFPDNENGVVDQEGRRNSSCYRDIGYFVDALAADLENGGNQNVYRFVNFYKENGNVSFVSDELEETKFALSYAATMATAAMRNFEFSITGASTIPNTSTIDVGDNTGIPVGMSFTVPNFLPGKIFKVIELIDNDKISIIQTNNQNFNFNFIITGMTLVFSDPSGFDVAPVTDSIITTDTSNMPRCADVAERITVLLRDAHNLFDNEEVILVPEDISSLGSIYVGDNTGIPLCMRVAPTFTSAVFRVGRLLGDDRIMLVDSDGNYVTNYDQFNYPSGLGFVADSDCFDIEPVTDSTITTDTSISAKCANVAERIYNLYGQVADFFDGNSVDTEPIDIGYLNVGDNSGILVGMDISGDGIQPNMFVGKLVDNDKIIVKDSNDRLTGYIGNSPNTVTFSIKRNNMYFNELAPMVDASIIEDSPLTKCVEVAERIINLERNVIDLLSDKVIDIEEAEDNAITSPCYRDIGYFVDAIIGDLKSGGNLRSIKVGETYRSGNDINFIEGELEETISTYEYAKNVAIASMRNFTATMTRIETTTGSSTITVGDTSGLIVGMRVIDETNSIIPEDTVIKNVIDTEQVTLGRAGSTPTTGDEVVALSDNTAATLTFMSPEYLVWSDERISVDNSIIEDVQSPACTDIANRINMLSTDMINIIKGRTGVDVIPPIDLSEDNSQLGRGKYLDAANLIESNRELIKEEALGRIKSTNPNFDVPNDGDELCKRDIGFLVDSLVSDLRIGGNLNTLRTGENYRDGNKILFIEDELEETIEAFEYVGNLSTMAMRNFNLSAGVNLVNNSSQINVGSLGYELLDGMLIIGDGIPKDTYIKKNPTNQELVNLYDSKDFDAEYVYTGTGGTLQVTFELDASNALAYSEIVASVDPSVAVDGEMPPCADIATRIRGLIVDLVNVLDINSEVSEIIRVEPDSNVSGQTSRTTIFDIDVSGTGSSDAHNLQTGTPVRLVPRPKFNSSLGAYEDVDPRLVRLPKGFEPNKTYYVIAPGRKTQPYDYSNEADRSLFGQQQTTKLMLAETKESAIVGLYIYSPEGDSVDPNVEIDLYQFVSDESYDLERYKCIGVTGSTKINTNIGHNFDIPSTEENATKVFFRTILGSRITRLPEVSNILKRDFSVSLDGRIRDDVEFYVRPFGIKTFSVYKTLDDAVNDVAPIAFNYQDEEFNVFFNKKRSPLKYDASYGKWYLNAKRTSDFIIDRIKKSDYSGRLRTTDSWFTRIADNRKPEDRIYRLRYVIPSYNINVSPPANGFVLKLRTDDFRGLLPQKALVRGKVNLLDKNANKITITQEDFDRFGFTEELRYDPYRKSSLGDTRVRINTGSNVIATVQSARFVKLGGLDYTEIILMDPEVDVSNSLLKNATFTTVEISQPQNGNGKFIPEERVEWNNGVDSAIVQSYIENSNKHYLILRNVDGNLENDSSIVFKQDDVEAGIKGYPDFGRSLSIALKVEKDLDEYYYSKKNASVYTITPGDTFRDSSGNSFVIESVEDIGNIDNTYYIYTSDTIQEHIPNQQDGVYYLNVLKGDVSPFPTSAGVANNFKDYKFSQPIGSLYPIDFSNDPIWFKYAGTSQAERDYVRGLKDPLPTNSVADNFLHGLVTVNDTKRSATKEAILDLLNNDPFAGSSYVLEAQRGNALAGAEDRLIPIMGDDPYVSRSRLYIELRRYSIARAGNHTFEYLGYGPGNYSTALPIRQQQVKTPIEDFYSQSKKENGGVVFYTGSDSTGGFYIGNRRFDSITNEEEILESAAIVSDTESDSDIITDLVETFISPVTFNENITVLGGDGSDPSIFESPLVISVQAIDLTQIDYPLTIRSNVNPAIDDRLLDRTNFRPLISGDITIGKNTIRSASFELSPRAFGQGYSIRTHAINGSASNATPLPNTPNRLSDFGINSPKSGDIVLRGRNIEEFGSVGWIYTNRLLDSVPLTEISEITFDPFFDRVSIYWTVPRRNDNQGVVNTAEVTFDGFAGDYSFMNGRWTVVESDRRYNGGKFSVSDTVVVLEGFNVPEVESLTVLGSVSIRISLANWKEVGVLGAEAIRTYTGELGEYRTGINTVARSNQDDYENGYVTPIVSPRFNLDVVGDALITGENIDYNSAPLMVNRDITNAENALIVGYSSNDVLSNNFVNSAGLRVSSKNPGGWKIGINVNYDIVDTGYDFIVNGPVQYRSDKFQLTNNVVIGTSEATGEVSIFDKKINDNDVSIGEPFAGTITIGNDASVINISSSDVDTANEVNIGRGDSLSETSSIVNIKSSSLNVYGNARFGANKDVEDKLTLSTAAGEVSIFDSIPSDITLGNVASRISIGSFVGDTIVNNRLKVSSEFEISGSITLFGGSDSSSYNVKRDNILGTYAISHAEGDFRDTNVDVIVLDETFVLELDYPGGGGWTIGTGEYPYTFFFKINTDREELGELEGELYNDNIGDNIRVGDFLFIADGEQREILKVVDVTNLLGDSQNRKSIVIERNPLNVSGIALPSNPYKDVTTKVKKATVITSSSYLDIPMNEESSVVSLGTFTGSVKTGDYFLLSGVEFVEIESVASTQPRKFSVLEGLGGPSMLEVNTFEKIINIGTDTVNITGKELNIASSGMTFSIRDEVLGSEDIFRVNSAERSISINAELFNVKVGSSASPILNIDSTTNMGRGSIIVDTGAVSITSDELSFNISKIAFTVPSAEGDVFTLINNPTREAKFNTDLFEVDTEVLDVTAEELNLRVVSPSDDPRINLPDLLNIDGDEKSITVNSDDTTLRSSMLRITGENVLIDSANLDFTSQNLTLNFSNGSDEVFSIKTAERIGKFNVTEFEFIAQDFDIAGADLEIKSDKVAFTNKNLSVNVDPTGSNNIFSLVIDNPTNILDGPPTNLLKTDGVDYDIDDSDFDLQSTQLTINSDSSLIESTILDLKIGDSDSPIFTIDTTYNSNKGSVAFDVGKFAATAEALDLEGNPLTISGNNFNIDSESTTFSNKNFFVNIAPDPPLGESRKSIFNVVLDSNTDPETRSFMLDIYDFDVISTELTLDSMDMTLTGDLLSMESKSIFLDSEHLSIKVDPTGSRDIFVFDSNKLNIDNVPESVVKFDVDNFTIDANTLNVVNEITNINSSLSNINIRNLTFESPLAAIDIGKTVVDGVNESLFHVSTSLNLVKFQNANEIRLESLQTNLTSDAVNVTTKDVALDITPDTSKPKLLSVVGNDTDRTIELNPDEYNLTSTNSTFEITNLTSTLGDNEDGAVDISIYGADIKVLDNRNNNVLRFINKVDGESSLNSSIDRIDIVTDRFTTTGNTLTLQNDNVVFNGDLIDFQSGSIISDVESANIRIGGVRLDTAQNRLSANMGVIALESTVNLDIDAVSSQIDITAADIEIQELELNVFGKERGADLIKVDGVNYSIELNVDNLDINVNDGGTASIDRLAIGNTFNAGLDSINSRGSHIHIGSYETANNYTDSRTTYFSVDTTGKTFIQRSLSIGDASAAANEIFKVDLDGSKEFVIKNDGSIDAFGIEGYYTPNGGRRAISVNVGTNYPGDRLPTLNVVYFFNPSGLAGRGTKRFDLPSGARNGDFIVWITTGNLTNTARLILGGNGTSVMGDTEGVMFNVPYASCTLYFYNGGWWLSDLP